MLYPGERTLNSIARQVQHDALLTEVLSLGRKAVYGQLLWYTNERGFNPGWAAHAFKEIYSTWPRSQDRCAPICAIGGPVEQWVALRPKKPRKKTAQRLEATEPH